MVPSKSLRMNASSACPDQQELPATTPRELKRPVKSLTDLEDRQPRKYIHVHHFKQTKLFGAWFNDPSKPGKKVRLFFGSHLTAYLAARAQDRAALKYKPHALDPRSIQLNFKEEDYADDQKLREMLTCEEFGELLRKESRPKYTRMEPTPCLRKFMDHERARGNIPSAVPPKEDVMSLRQYLKEVIRKREQPDEDMEDPVSADEESSEDRESSESSDEEMEEPIIPTAEQKKKHVLKVEQKKRSEGKRVVVLTQPRTPRSPVAGPSECKPLVTALAPFVWGQTRKRTDRYEDEYDQLQYKLHKLHIADPSTEKSREPGPPIKTDGLPTEVENTKSLEPGNEDLLQQSQAQFPELQFRSKWHYNVHKIRKLQTSRTNCNAEILPAEVENITKTPAAEPAGTEGPLPQSFEFPKLQFKTKWHSKQHKIQKLQTSRTSSEPSPNLIVEGSYLQALATTVLSQAGKLV